MYGYYYDWTYILVLIGALISIIASANVNATFKKYSRQMSARRLTGAEVAQAILERNGIYDIQVCHVPGNLTDHFDPRTGIVNLSDSVYSSTSVAALGVAAHECGHVLQHKTEYLPLKIRSSLVPVANFGSRFGIWVVVAGLAFAMEPITTVGIWLFSAAVAFQIVTLPVELDASRRALAMLEDYGLMGSDETRASRKVLGAAALTYVAAAAASVLQLARLLILRNRRRD
ncbi:zinc metallopeptidase [Butyrivibrio sp. MC2013]|uniref:zinc metallopeptidase n=1 Tax=Butyrivibrio sp. MC2013 TaxID=1280686 RepID=UPI000420015B|nr:zinc metallopeptidase [Butyrivibrio sp. MC2013]